MAMYITTTRATPNMIKTDTPVTNRKYNRLGYIALFTFRGLEVFRYICVTISAVNFGSLCIYIIRVIS